MLCHTTVPFGDSNVLQRLWRYFSVVYSAFACVFVFFERTPLLPGSIIQRAVPLMRSHISFITLPVKTVVPPCWYTNKRRRSPRRIERRGVLLADGGIFGGGLQWLTLSLPSLFGLFPAFVSLTRCGFSLYFRWRADCFHAISSHRLFYLSFLIGNWALISAPQDRISRNPVILSPCSRMIRGGEERNGDEGGIKDEGA